jgi:hypothetical protein
LELRTNASPRVGVTTVQIYIVMMGVVLLRGQNPSVEDIARGMRDTFSNLDSYSVTSTFELVYRPVAPSGKSTPLKSVVTQAIERSGRVKLHRYGESFTTLDDGELKVYKEEVAAVFDGTTAWVLEGEDEKFSFGLITHRRDAIPKKVDPWDYFTNYSGYRVDDLFAFGKSTVTGKAKWDGDTVLTIETLLEPEAEYQRKFQFMVNPTYGFAPVRRASLVQFPSSASWHEYDTLEAHDYIEAYPGIWAPQVLKYRHHRVKNGEISKEPSEEWTAHNEHWVVNAKLPDTQFSLGFPAGVRVTDDVNGLRYNNTTIDDAMLDRLSKEGEDLRREFAALPPVSLAQQWDLRTPAIALTLVSATLILWQVVVRVARSKRQQSI